VQEKNISVDDDTTVVLIGLVTTC